MTPSRFPACLTGFFIVIMLLAASAMPVFAERAEPQTIPPSIGIQLDKSIKDYVDWYEAENCEFFLPGDMSFCHAGEYKEARRFCFGDIDGDGTDDIAVRYTRESFCCGNNYYF